MINGLNSCSSDCKSVLLVHYQKNSDFVSYVTSTSCCSVFVFLNLWLHCLKNILAGWLTLAQHSFLLHEQIWHLYRSHSQEQTKKLILVHQLHKHTLTFYPCVSLKSWRCEQVEPSCHGPSFFPWTYLQYNYMIPHWLPTAETLQLKSLQLEMKPGRTRDINTPVILLGGEPILLPSSAC